MRKTANTPKNIGLAKETESPENPGALEKRVAIIPQDISKLVESGHRVFVEEGAGEGIGFSDSEYVFAGATLQTHEEIYSDKDILIKFKGPSLESISRMNPKTILFCMAHFRSFQERANLLKKNKINVIAMEEILESPKYISDQILASKRFIEETLAALKTPYSELSINFLGYHLDMVGGIRRAGNRNSKNLTLYQSNIKIDELKYFGQSSIYFYDSRVMKNDSLIKELITKECKVYDLKSFIETDSQDAIKKYRESHPPFEFGGRRIQCLHVTGMAGARYGFKLLKDSNDSETNKLNACVLGYGNVGMGAIDECYRQGLRSIQILGRTQTRSENIQKYLNDSDLIINGAEQAPELRGVNYLIKKEYIGNSIKKGSVVIDLVGGSALNRSPVEDIIECTYLTDPSFEREGVYFSALWGWPMMGMMKESAITYSGQIIDVLLKREQLINGLDELAPGVKRALVCGPFIP